MPVCRTTTTELLPSGSIKRDRVQYKAGEKKLPVGEFQQSEKRAKEASADNAGIDAAGSLFCAGRTEHTDGDRGIG